MRIDFSELEFQFALMLGYYVIEKNIEDLGFYMPSAKEENKTYAADWFLENCKGVNLFLQFKKSIYSSNNRFVVRKNQTTGDRELYKERKGEVFEFPIRIHNNHHQHNLLFRKLSQINSLSFYVAPMFTERKELFIKMKSWLNGEGYTDEYSYRFLRDNIIVSPNRLNGHFSFFDDVIYIKPHREINDNTQHHYCFNKRRQVSFHSEIENLKTKGYSFIGVLSQLRMILDQKNISMLESTNYLFELIKSELGKNNKKESEVYTTEGLLNTSIKESDDMLTQIEALKQEKKLEEYIFGVNNLLEELFEISRIFVYKKGF